MASADAIQKAVAWLNNLGTQAHDLADALQAPDTPAATPGVTYGRLIYIDPSVDGKWALQVLQGQPATISRLPALRQAGAKQLLRYTHAMTRTANDAGIRQAYDKWDDAWLARDKAGNPIISARFRSGPGGRDPNMLIDVGNLAYQRESASYLVRKCAFEGWTGIYLDEINQRQEYAGYSVPAKYGTDEEFQEATLLYVAYVAKVLRNNGFTCHINLGSDYDDWAKAICAECTGQHIEYFIAQRSLPNGIATLDNGEFPRQLAWLQWNEDRGLQTICQADARSTQDVQYALAAYLLITRGFGVFAAFNGAYGSGTWWTPAQIAAQKLGPATGPYRVENGLWVRDFANGKVTVNPNKLQTIRGLVGASSLIDVR